MARFQDVALRFARAMARGAFEAAHALLSEAARRELTSEDLETAFAAMVGEHGRVKLIEVTAEMVDWPAKQTGDIGWAYVAMSGANFSEGVAVTLCKDQSATRIRDIVWGRP